jgi:hypothetical protein
LGFDLAFQGCLLDVVVFLVSGFRLALGVLGEWNQRAAIASSVPAVK